MRLLEGDEEREYWERLQRERSEKITHKAPRQKKRGRQKVDLLISLLYRFPTLNTLNTLIHKQV